MNNPRLRKLLDSILVPVLAVLSGLVVMGILILFLKKPLFESYAILFSKGFGCEAYGNCLFITTLERATPLILTGLSAVVAFRSGMFSIGQEGQYLLGAAMAAWLGYAIHLPPIVHALVLMSAAMLMGAAYGWIPGILRVKLGVNELLATIMLNAIAVLIVEYLVQFPMRADTSAVAHSPVIDQTAQLMSFLPGSKWGMGFVIAVIAVIVVYIYLWRTKSGYEQRMAGQSKRFALFGGIRSDRAAVRAMLISGALAGRSLLHANVADIAATVLEVATHEIGVIQVLRQDHYLGDSLSHAPSLERSFLPAKACSAPRPGKARHGPVRRALAKR